MITGALLLVALGLSWFMLAGWRTGSLTVLERGYLILSPLPVLGAFGGPLATTVLWTGAAADRLWSNRLTTAGIWLSGALVLAGFALMWRRRARGDTSEGRLGAGLFLAGFPAFLTLVVVAFYALRG